MSEENAPLVASGRMTVSEVYSRLKQMITSFELYPGTKVTETQIAEVFGISRTPIRQVLQRLEVEGFIEIRSKRGCFIRELNGVELAEFYEVRIALERLIIESAVSHMPDKAVHEFMEQWSPEQHEIDFSQGVDLGEKDETFHVGLAEASGKPVMAEMLKTINNRIRIIRRLDLNADNRSLRTYQEHTAILQCILHRDATKAKRMMKQHIARSLNYAKTLTLTALAHKRPNKLGW